MRITQIARPATNFPGVVTMREVGRVCGQLRGHLRGMS